jgi:acyl-CoA oxidase
VPNVAGRPKISSFWSRVRRFWSPAPKQASQLDSLAEIAPRDVLPSAAELARFVYGLSPEDAQFREAVKSLLASPAFERSNGLTMDEQAKRSYERFKLLRDTLDLRARDVVERPARLTAVLELVGAVDGTLFTVMSIHYCLCVGSILRHGSSAGRPASEPLAPELARYLEELDSLDSIGTFLVTELGYGNNVVSLETRAEYDSARRELRLTTPSQLAA